MVLSSNFVLLVLAKYRRAQIVYFKLPHRLFALLNLYQNYCGMAYSRNTKVGFFGNHAFANFASVAVLSSNFASLVFAKYRRAQIVYLKIPHRLFALLNLLKNYYGMAYSKSLKGILQPYLLKCFGSHAKNILLSLIGRSAYGHLRKEKK